MRSAAANFTDIATTVNATTPTTCPVKAKQPPAITVDIDDPRQIKCIEGKIKFKLPIGGIHRPYITKSAKKTSLYYKVYALPTMPSHKGGKPNIRLRNTRPCPRTSSVLINLEWRKNGGFLRPYKPHALALASFNQDETISLLKLV